MMFACHRVLVVSKKFSGLTDKIEKWYGTQYSLEKIPESTIQVDHSINYNYNPIMQIDSIIIMTLLCR